MASGGMDFVAQDTILYCLLHLLKGVHLDLTPALARHAELVGEHIERDRLVAKPPRLEDAALALVQHRERFAQCLAAIVGLVVLGELRLLACSLLYQPLLPLPGFAILANRRIEREVA